MKFHALGFGIPFFLSQFERLADVVLSRFAMNLCANPFETRHLEAARTPDERNRLLRMIAIHSLQSWGHIDLLGECDFSSEQQRNNSGVLPPKTIMLSVFVRAPPAMKMLAGRGAPGERAARSSCPVSSWWVRFRLAETEARTI